MRLIGTQAHGIRLPIINKGDELAEIVVDSVTKALESEDIQLTNNDIIGITEAIVAKAQNNFATISDISNDIKTKFADKEIGVVFPILSRNRFLNILKGISLGAKKVYVLLKYPQDEFGNPIMDATQFYDFSDELQKRNNSLISAKEFQEITHNFVHPFTGMNYISLYEQAGDNIEVFLSSDARDILKLTKQVLVCEVHTREHTKHRLEAAGAESVYMLSDILSEPSNDHGYNPEYGVLGSNIATDETLKLFPRNSQELVNTIQQKFNEKIGVKPEVLVYGDGAFKDPVCGIWELADPTVSPAHTERLDGLPNEIKLKFVAENNFHDLNNEDKQKAVTDLIREKNLSPNKYSLGTTPRKYADLIGSLCDLMSGSGDKGTPVILIQGYFDDYASK